jgi:hypothetical protein
MTILSSLRASNRSWSVRLMSSFVRKPVCERYPRGHRGIPARDALVDIDLNKRDGLALVRVLHAHHPDLRILVLSTQEEARHHGMLFGQIRCTSRWESPSDDCSVQECPEHFAHLNFRARAVLAVGGGRGPRHARHDPVLHTARRAKAGVPAFS